jgi:acetyl esterase
MPLAPALQTLLDSLASVEVPEIWEQPLQQARDGAILFAQAGAGPKDPVARVSDRTIPGPAGDIPVRVYVPTETDEPLPVVAYFHGGGWVFMGIETHDWICRRLANASGAIVVSVEYRLAPEDPFPAPLDDCHAVTQWLAEHAEEIGGDGAHLAIAGDSAGGNIAAGVTLRARAAGPPIAAQVLIYPATDAACDTKSFVENGEGYLLTETATRWFWEQYLGGTDPDDPFACPARAADLAGLPPALVITAEYDPLRDEGETYAARLDGFDVPVEQHRYDGMIHGFLGMRELVPEADDAMKRIATFLQQAFGPG